jgi:uncharacterized LabA/DUF88 family protein
VTRGFTILCPAPVDRVAVILDGGFVRKKLEAILATFPTASDFQNLVAQIMGKAPLAGMVLFRVYHYDSPPFRGSATNPLDGSVINFRASKWFRDHQSLLDSLEMEPNFSVGRGTSLCHGWKLGSAALRSLAAGPRLLVPHDILPDIEQKGVDIRIGLDVAMLALKRIVEAIVVVSGDSDLAPVMSFAQREGLRVYLDTLGHPVRPELRANSDIVL